MEDLRKVEGEELWSEYNQAILYICMKISKNKYIIKKD